MHLWYNIPVIQIACCFNSVRYSWFCNFLPLQSFVPELSANAATSSSVTHGTKTIRYVGGIGILLDALTTTFLET
jgi:hypothetical protein